MVGQIICHNGQLYEVTEWDPAQGRVAINPADSGLQQLLRQVIITNMPLLYYHSSGVYCVIHPNLPTPKTTA